MKKQQAQASADGNGGGQGSGVGVQGAPVEVLVFKDGQPADGDWSKITSGLHEIPIGLVAESPENARKTFDAAALAELADSLKKNGQIEPASVRPFPAERTLPLPLESLVFGALDNRVPQAPQFELIGGARRWRALLLNGALTIRCEVHDVPDDAVALLRGIEANESRADVPVLEKARGWQRLMELGKYKSAAALCAACGKTGQLRSIQNLLQLVNPDKVDPAVTAALAAGTITESHAVLVAHQPKAEQAATLELCFERRYIDGKYQADLTALKSEKDVREQLEARKQVEDREKKHAAQRAADDKKYAAEQRKRDAERVEQNKKWEAERRADARKQKKRMEALYAGIGDGELPAYVLARTVFVLMGDVGGHREAAVEELCGIPKSTVENNDAGSWEAAEFERFVKTPLAGLRKALAMLAGLYGEGDYDAVLAAYDAPFALAADPVAEMKKAKAAKVKAGKSARATAIKTKAKGKKKAA